MSEKSNVVLVFSLVIGGALVAEFTYRYAFGRFVEMAVAVVIMLLVYFVLEGIHARVSRDRNDAR